MYEILDTGGCSVDVLVLPDADDGPANLSKTLVGVAIPLTIGLNFFAPEGGVALRLRCMLGTSVPEAAIDEHSNTGGSENDVDAPAAVRKDGSVDAEPESTRMERAAKFELSARITSANRR